MSQNRNLLIGLAIFIEIAAAVAYFMYYYQPTQIELKTLQATVEKKSREVREIEMTKRLLAEKRNEISRLKADIARLERYFPEEVFIPRVLVLLENLAQATHLRIENIKPGMLGAARAGAAPAAAPTAAPAAAAAARPATTPVPGAAATSGTAAGGSPNAIKFDQNREYKTISVDFNVVGTFQNVGNFMNELTTFPKLVVVDTLVLSPTGAKEIQSGSSGQQGAPDVGGAVNLNAKMPLTFYIQQAKQPEF